MKYTESKHICYKPEGHFEGENPNVLRLETWKIRYTTC